MKSELDVPIERQPDCTACGPTATMVLGVDSDDGRRASIGPKRCVLPRRGAAS